MKTAAILLLSAVCILIASPASAQLSNGKSGTSSAPTAGTEEEYWWLMRQMGDCLADNKTELAITFLQTKIGSNAETAAFKKLFGRSRNMCMRTFVSASFLRAHVRGAIAEGLYRRNIAQVGIDIVPIVTKPEKIQSIHDFARCYISSDYKVAQNFLNDTRLATNREAEMVKYLVPTFAKCLPEGRDITLKATNVRMAFAEAMYHATVLTRAGGVN